MGSFPRCPGQLRAEKGDQLPRVRGLPLLPVAQGLPYTRAPGRRPRGGQSGAETAKGGVGLGRPAGSPRVCGSSSIRVPRRRLRPAGSSSLQLWAPGFPCHSLWCVCTYTCSMDLDGCPSDTYAHTYMRVNGCVGVCVCGRLYVHGCVFMCISLGCSPFQASSLTFEI